MLSDAFLPPGLPAPPFQEQERDKVRYRSARWSPEDLGGLADQLAGEGARALVELPPRRVLAAWRETVALFRNPGSPERHRLDPALARLCRFSPEGLTAGLEAVLGGVTGAPAEELFRQAESFRSSSAGGGSSEGARETGPIVALLASNLPALGLQPLLPALALGRGMLLKSPSAEPLFLPAFLEALTRREPQLAPALAAVTWPGGDAELEAPVLAGAGRVLAYGEQQTVEDVARRAPCPVVVYGPKTSLAVVGDLRGEDADVEEIAAGLARDVALFDQRGCLSVAAVWVEGDEEAARRLARALADALGERARAWPPGPAEPRDLAAVQQLRLEAAMRGLERPVVGEDDPAAGTVVVEPKPRSPSGSRRLTESRLLPTPGLRTVRVQPLPDLASLPEILAPWRGRLQGAALAGSTARALAPALEDLGISRTSAPGRLQSPDVLWHNGGRHPLHALAGTQPAGGEQETS